MGLDMYLTKRIYIGADYDFNKITGNIELFRDGEKINIDLNKVSYIEESVGYWRKANAIHKWFVDNVQDGKDECQEVYVDQDQLKELLNLVNQVLENHKLVKKLLPTQSGFFFGDTEYGQYYFDDLKYTKELLESIVDSDESFYYSSSW
jgi:hypothetical protein